MSKRQERRLRHKRIYTADTVPIAKAVKQSSDAIFEWLFGKNGLVEDGPGRLFFAVWLTANYQWVCGVSRQFGQDGLDLPSRRETFLGVMVGRMAQIVLGVEQVTWR
jgi:hypothetical protein